MYNCKVIIREPNNRDSKLEYSFKADDLSKAKKKIDKLDGGGKLELESFTFEKEEKKRTIGFRYQNDRKMEKETQKTLGDVCMSEGLKCED